MADSILRLRVESQEYDNKLKRAAEGIQRLAAKIHDSQGEFVGLTNEQKDFIRNLQYMNTVSQTATGKVKELETAYKGLQTMYNGFNAFEKNSEEGKILAEQLSILKEKTLQARKEMEDANKSLSSTGSFLDRLTSKFTVNIDALKLFDIGLNAAGSALDVAKDAFFSSETTLDEWGRTMEASESLYQGFLSALNNSDISGFLSRMDEIVGAARNAYNAMDELGTYTAFQQRNVAKGRAGYAQALDEFKLNPTDENKNKLRQANEKVMSDLRESHEKTEAAYQAALQKIATERIGDKGMQAAFVKMFSKGNYGDLQAAKSSYSTGRGLNSGAQYYYGDRVYDGRIQDRFTGKWRDMDIIEKQQFEFARALSQVNDSQIEEVQALGAQSERITEQIYQQDRSYNRQAGNNEPPKGSGRSGGGRSGGGNSSQKTEEQLNTESIQKLTQEYVKATEERRTAIREEIKALQERNDIIQTMKNEALGKYKPIEPMGEAEGIMPGGFYSTPTSSMQKAQLSIKTPLQTLEEELKNLTAFRDASMTSGDWQNRNFLVQAKQQEISGYKGETQKKEEDEMKKLTNKMSSLTSGISSITGGLQSMGVELPKGLQETISVINGLMAIVQGVSTVISVFSTGAETANTVATTANTIALGAMTTALYANTAVSAIPFFRGGGIAHAARGFVPGNDHNDNIPVMVSSGELILNRAQQGNLASQLEGGGLNGMQLHAVITGEQLRLVLNNNSRRTGRGEYVTTNFTRS